MVTTSLKVLFHRQTGTDNCTMMVQHAPVYLGPVTEVSDSAQFIADHPKRASMKSHRQKVILPEPLFIWSLIAYSLFLNLTFFSLHCLAVRRIPNPDNLLVMSFTFLTVLSKFLFAS